MLLANRANNLFDEMFMEPFFSDSNWKKNTQMMKTDVKEEDGNYLIEMELPGYAKEDIHAELNNGYLTINAEHKESKEKKDKKGNYIRKERYSGSLSRTFYIGEQVSEDKIHAEFKNGVLHLTVPKMETKKEEPEKLIEIQ